MNLRVNLVAALTAAIVTSAALAHEPEAPRHVRMHGPHSMSLAHVAMRNVVAELAAAKSGKPLAEVRAVFEKSHPHAAMEALGLSEDDMKVLFQQAHTTLVDRAATAGLITPEQAQELRGAKIALQVRKELRPRAGEHGDSHTTH